MFERGGNSVGGFAHGGPPSLFRIAERLHPAPCRDTPLCVQPKALLQFGMNIWRNSPYCILSLLLSSTSYKFCFSEIVERTALAPATVTSNLRRLQQAEFVLRQKEPFKPESEFRASYVYYTLNPDAIHHLRLHAPS